MSSIPARRRVRKTPDARREEIAAAAVAIAREQGLLGVTLRAVAARADVAPGLVAHYAPSMDDLVATAFSSLVSAELADVDAFVRAEPDPLRRVAMLIDTLLDGSRDDVTLVWVQAWALGPRSDALAAAVRTEMDAWQSFIGALVAAGTDAGVFRVTDAAAVAWQMLAMIDGLNAHALVHWHAAPERHELTKRSVAALLGLPADAFAPAS